MTNIETDTGQSTHQSTGELNVDLCVVGAGIAGLNALYVASEYLPKGAKVALVERRGSVGGMWNDVYDFVRLHQPHAMFTAGNIPWLLKKPADYLATGQEVQDHLVHCLDVIRTRLDLTELFGHEVEKVEEITTNGAIAGRVTVSTPTADGFHITATQVVQAQGLDISANLAMSLSSPSVTSTTPEALRGSDAAHGKGPFFVVGGGKTGMDTVAELLDGETDREITLLNGRGTVFAKRDYFLPRPGTRWWRGKPVMKILRDVATRFDGTNEHEVFDYFRGKYAISPDGTGDNFLFAYLGQDECDRIADGLTNIVPDYLEDVVEGENGPEIVLRSGKRVPVLAGAVFVNCSGYVMHGRAPATPVLSEGGAILTISTRAAIHFLTSVSAYFLSHTFFAGKLRDSGLRTLDMDRLYRTDSQLWAISATTLAFMNTMTLLNTLPFKVLDACGLDLDRWYPMHRRAGALLDVKLNQKRYVATCTASLDKVAARHDVLGGVAETPPKRAA